MAIVYLLCGLPTSGKTTYARKLEASNHVVRFTLDERMITKFDYSMFDDEYGPLATEEKLLMWQEAQVFLASGNDVVLDWSLWNRMARTEWTQKVVEAGYAYKLLYFEVPLEGLCERLEARNAAAPTFAHQIPVDELRRFSAIFEPPSNAENLHLIVIKQDE